MSSRSQQTQAERVALTRWRVRYLRERHNLKLREIAALLNIHISSVRNHLILRCPLCGEHMQHDAPMCGFCLAEREDDIHTNGSQPQDTPSNNRPTSPG